MRLSFRLAVLLLSLLALELGARAGVGLGWLRYTEKHIEGGGRQYLDDIHPAFGVWHYPDVELPGIRTNSHGMRDRERKLEAAGAPRVALIGDSFVEGYGVVDGQRMSDHLERKAGIEHLNFGCSGGFGPLQQALLYETLALRFEHDRVYLFCLPDNDFEDLVERDPGRYRPYLRPDGEGGYRVVYPVDFEARQRARPPSLAKRLRLAARNHSRFLNALGQVRLAHVFPSLQGADPAYDRFDPGLGEQLLHCYGRLVAAAAPRPVWVFVIPRRADLLASARGRLEGRAPALLRAWAEGQPRVQVVDLLPLFERELEQRELSPESLFLPNDGHWSPFGNRLAALLVMEATGAAVAPEPPREEPR
jgi:hypothetical protein